MIISKGCELLLPLLLNNHKGLSYLSRYCSTKEVEGLIDIVAIDRVVAKSLKYTISALINLNK